MGCFLLKWDPPDCYTTSDMQIYSVDKGFHIRNSLTTCQGGWVGNERIYVTLYVVIVDLAKTSHEQQSQSPDKPINPTERLANKSTLRSTLSMVEGKVQMLHFKTMVRLGGRFQAASASFSSLFLRQRLISKRRGITFSDKSRCCRAGDSKLL